VIDRDMNRTFKFVNGGVSVDDVEYVRELALTAENDGQIYERCGKPCIENLQRKIKRGVFDPIKAPKIFQLRYLDLARESYYKKYRIQSDEDDSLRERTVWETNL
jgi:hypothetical protein